MIFYYSATGNCKYVAKLLSESLGDTRVYAMLDCLDSENLIFEGADGEKLGFITPTYFFGLPLIVTEFVQKVKIEPASGSYVYHIASYGTSTGGANAMMAKLLAEKGIALSGRFGIKMVDTWTPAFNLTDRKKMQRITDAAKPQIDAITQKINAGYIGDFHNVRLPYIMASGLYNSRYNKGAGGDTGNFTVEDSCIGCGLCEKKCPSVAIQMQNKRPVWVKDTCNLCLGCLHRCPKFAIQYGDKTKKHGQFQNPYEKV